MFNKRGEGRASSLVISLVLALSLLMWFATLVTNIVVNNGVTDVPEFKAYKEVYDDSITDSNTLIGSIESEENLTGIDKIKAKLNERYEDSIFRRVFKGLQLTYKSSSIMARSLSINDTQGTLFKIPDIVKVTISVILGLTLMFLVVKAWWRFKEI